MTHPPSHTRGFTLIETLVAISLLMLAVIEPMTLTLQSLKVAYYARDQITASHLAQEAIEAVRSVRDAHMLNIQKTGTCEDIFGGILPGQDFRIDTTNDTITSCSGDPGGVCKPLQTDGTLYGYQSSMTINTAFTRTLLACYIQPPPSTSCNNTPSDEVRLLVTVTWRTGSFAPRTITIQENLYRWLVCT